MRRGEVSDSAKDETRTNVRTGVVGSESVIMIDHQVDSVVESLPFPTVHSLYGVCITYTALLTNFIQRHVYLYTQIKLYTHFLIYIHINI